ncbi:lipopolysaccharide transport periplasmic protein LptA [Shewanella gaetbuli]|uniref:Lipopolysaccharide export system protein LptA n=1 Tax=Shewanella gaetbuli TaxID=220752 RepID=A0A9X2CJ57_9GAMM|nr:lipopolysaccharide transport periplasmic protein LptA [Shewanella gaetbuli]MCL1143762.1 lipopolysaccharide transport periplasmic protein LptA [Shewanella gaetbuli]
MNHIKTLPTLLKGTVVISCLLSLFSVNVAAKEGDLQQELKIAAVSQRADIKNNQIIFNGPVKITQGTININADELRAFSAENGQTKTLVAIGNPATFSQEMDDGRIGTASANEIRYDLATTGLLLTGNAKLDQSGSQVTGNVIRYNIEAQELVAESTGKGEDRVITIIQPENFQTEEKPKQKLPQIPVKKQGNQ